MPPVVRLRLYGNSPPASTKRIKRCHCAIEKFYPQENAYYAATPNCAPTTVVDAIANASQNATRHVALVTDELPERAATPPRSARNNVAPPATAHMIDAAAASYTIFSGDAAPTENVAAQATAACTGRVVMISEMRSSSRACAPSARCDINCVATSDASTGFDAQPR